MIVTVRAVGHEPEEIQQIASTVGVVRGGADRFADRGGWRVFRRRPIPISTAALGILAVSGVATPKQLLERRARSPSHRRRRIGRARRTTPAPSPGADRVARGPRSARSSWSGRARRNCGDSHRGPGRPRSPRSSISIVSTLCRRRASHYCDGPARTDHPSPNCRLGVSAGATSS